MLFLLDFQVNYPTSMGQQDLFEIWMREADAALAAKKAGSVVDLWKCAGTRRVIAIVDVGSHDDLDRILLDLPIMVEHGQHVQVEISPLRRYEDFAHDMKERVGKKK